MDGGRPEAMIDLTADLTAWLGTPEVRALLKSIVTDAVRDEIRVAFVGGRRRMLPRRA